MPFFVAKQASNAMPRESGTTVRRSLPITALSCAQKQNPYLHTQIGVSEFNLDDDLLSHGETPHYHRRCIVSLLSSGWDQVVPMLYGRQEIRVPNRLSTLQQIGYAIVCVFVRTFGSLRLHTPQSGAFSLFSSKHANCLGVIWSSLTGN